MLLAHARWMQVAGRASKRKGSAGEREFANLIGGKRVPLSGAHPDLPGDVKGLGMTWEVKRRADGFKELYKWLEGKDALAVRSDRHQWLVCMPLETFLRMVGVGFADAPEAGESMTEGAG